MTTVGATPTALFTFALGGDSRLPTGSHTQSAGLEPALLGGLLPEQTLAFIRTRLATVTRVDAASAAVAWRYLADGRSLDPVAAAWAARTPSADLRAAAVEVGRGYARLLRGLGVDMPNRLPRPLAMAHYARYVGLDQTAIATLVAYDDVQSVLAALLKLEPLDPTTTVQWALAARSDVDALVTAVASLTEPDDIPAFSAPLLEQWHADHAMTTRRLFRA